MRILGRERITSVALLFLFVFAPLAANAQKRKPDIELSGEITGKDNHSYKLIPFEVSEGVSRITVKFAYSGKNEKTTLDIGIFDPQRLRGWSGGNKSEFTIAESDATPSYLPGVIVAGTWKLIIGIPNIRAQSRSEYHAEIYFARTAEQRNEDGAFSAPRGGPGWYRGDLHMHTASSDGSCASKSGKKVPCPLFKTLETASERKLDFIAVTDHNDTSHFEQMRELAPYYDSLLLLHGREVTTFHGHANVYGTDAPIDFRVGTREVPDVNALLEEVKDVGGLISINHPNDPTGEMCMGCGWDQNPSADLHMVQAVEAVNSADSGTPYSGIQFWTSVLNQGFRLTGIGGSDNHDADLPADERGAIGHPTTVVYAANLSEREILAGIKAGHVFIDVQGSGDHMLDLRAKLGTESASMGDNLVVPAGTKVELAVHITHAKGGDVEIIRDGKDLDVLKPATIASDDEVRTFEVTSDGQRHWVRATVRDATGKTLLVGNPIYLNFCCTQTAQDSSTVWLPGRRALMDAHNCYPYEGKWKERVQQALSAGTPLAIEQDLALYRDPKSHQSRVVVSHKADVDGTEPTLESYFIDAIRPTVEQALRDGDRTKWPLITLNLDFKSDDPELIRAVWSILGKYKSWLTTAVRGNSIYDVQPMHVGPVLVLTGESDAQQKIFFDEVPADSDLLTFGAVHLAVHDPSASPEALLIAPVNNYRRWVNFAWPVVEPEGQNNAGAWTEAKDARLQSLVARAHELGYWVRFYTLDGGSPEQFKEKGWLSGYNFGSAKAVQERWTAAIHAGADFIATDEYEALGAMITRDSAEIAKAKH